MSVRTEIVSGKAIAILAGVALLATGCQTMGFVPGGPTAVWSKAGTTRAQRRMDFEECVLAAAQAIQPAMGVASTPGFSSPGTLMCNSYGTMTTCNNVGGMNIQPTTYSYDSNSSTRGLYAKVCMEKKGYVQAASHFCQDPNDQTTEDCVVPYH